MIVEDNNWVRRMEVDDSIKAQIVLKNYERIVELQKSKSKSTSNWS